MKDKKTILERFFKFVKITESCWIWTGSKTRKNGYGQLSINGRPQRCNRISYKFFKGNIPDKLMVCHTCDNPSCVNPDHLFLGNQFDNMRDMKKKGRQKIVKGTQKPLSKLNESQIVEIRRSYLNPFRSKELSNRFNVSKQTILDIVNFRAWKHI